MELDLKKLTANQESLNEYAEPNMEIIKKLRKTSCLKKAQQQETSQQQQQKNEENEKQARSFVTIDQIHKIDSFNMPGTIKTSSTKKIFKKRKACEDREDYEKDILNIEESTNPYIKSPSKWSSRSGEQTDLTDNSKPESASFENYKQALQLPNQLVLTHGRKQWMINTPSHSKDSPNRPKITKPHIEALKKLCKLCHQFPYNRK